MRHTPGPWIQDAVGREDHEREIKNHVGWFLLVSAGYPFSKMANPDEARAEFEANVQIIEALPDLVSEGAKLLRAARNSNCDSAACDAFSVALVKAMGTA